MMLRALVTLLLAMPLPASAEAVPETLQAAINSLRDAALSGQTERAEPHLAADLQLLSQSGRLYGRDEALADLRSGFESWVIEEQDARADSGLVRVVSIVRRKRKGLEEGRFRVLQVWRPAAEGQWKLVAQASVRMKP